MAIVKSLFGEYFDWAQNLDFAMAEIVGFVISHEKMSARLTIKPYKKFEKERIEVLENTLSRAVGVHIKIDCDESRTGFTTEFMPMVVEILRDKIIVANGYFNNAEYEISGRELKVNLKKGGKEILASANCEKEIERIIKGIFGVDYTVTLCQEDDFNTEKAIDSMQKKADEEIRRERNIPEPQVITQPDEPKPHVVKDGFPLYLETQKPIYGSLIRTGNLQSLIDVGIESGAVTVWGEVFSLDVRTTRDGKNNIINFNITDKT